MTFVWVGRLRSGKPLRRNALIKIESVLHALQARFPLRRRLRLVRGLLRKACALRPLPLLLPSLQEGRLRGRGLGMHLVLRPLRLPLLPLDLGPVRGVEVSLVAPPVRASASSAPSGAGKGEVARPQRTPPARAASSVASPRSSQHAL